MCTLAAATTLPGLGQLPLLPQSAHRFSEVPPACLIWNRHAVTPTDYLEYLASLNDTVFYTPAHDEERSARYDESKIRL